MQNQPESVDSSLKESTGANSKNDDLLELKKDSDRKEHVVNKRKKKSDVSSVKECTKVAISINEKQLETTMKSAPTEPVGNRMLKEHTSCNSSLKESTDGAVSQNDNELELSKEVVDRVPVVKLLRLSQNTINGILQKGVAHSSKQAIPRHLSKIQLKDYLTTEMEKHLSQWVIKNAKKNCGRVRRDKVMKKASQIFQTIKDQAGPEFTDIKFTASREWFLLYRHKSGWDNPMPPCFHKKSMCYLDDLSCINKHNETRTRSTDCSKNCRRSTDCSKNGRKICLQPTNTDSVCHSKIQTSATHEKSVCNESKGTASRKSPSEEEEGKPDSQINSNSPLSSAHSESSVDRMCESEQNIDISVPSLDSMVLEHREDGLLLSRLEKAMAVLHPSPPLSNSPAIHNSGEDMFVMKVDSRDESGPSTVAGSKVGGSSDIGEEYKENPALAKMNNNGNETHHSVRRLLENVIKQENYIPQQIFNVSELKLFWKKLPEICGVETNVVDGTLPESKDPVMLLLSANASGDCKLVPLLVYSEENPQPISQLIKSTLPVVWKFHPRVKITASLFEEWFTYSFVPTVQVFCLEHNIPFKILLILDNSPCHAKILEFAHPNIRVFFIPSSISLSLKPMDQGICETFKANYLKRMFEIIVEVVGCENGDTLKSFWESFNILSALKIIDRAWCDVSRSVINAAWKVLRLRNLPKRAEITNPVAAISEEMKYLAAQLQLQIDERDISVWMDCHSYELTDQELKLLEKQNYSETKEGDLSPVTLTPSELSEAFRFIERAIKIFESEDPNFKRSSHVAENIRRSYQCYRQIYADQKRTSQQVNMLHDSVVDDNMETEDVLHTSEVNETSEVKPSVLDLGMFSANVDSSSPNVAI